MPITNITIENFKGVGDKVTVPLRPITLLFGANSAGKSTILQALLYLRELLERKNPDADVLAGCGNAINLGGFRELVHGHDISRKVCIGATMTVDDDGLPDYPVAVASDEGQAEHRAGADTYPEIVKTAGVTVEVENHPIEGPWISSYRVELNGVSQGQITCQPGETAKIFVNPEGRLFKVLLSLLDLNDSEYEDHDDEELLDEEDDSQEGEETTVNPELMKLATELASLIDKSERARGEVESLFKTGLQEGVLFEYGDGVIPHLDTGFTTLSFLAGLADTGYPCPTFETHRILSQVFSGAGQLILNELKRIRYIGPIRDIPSRRFEPERSPDPGRWADGMAAWDTLYKSRTRPEWLKETMWKQLGLGYDLDFSKVFVIPSTAKLGVALERLRSGQADALDAIKSVRREAVGYEEQYRFRLLTANGGLPVAPKDVGVGVSQALPVVIGAMQPGYSILAVEQPELHIHPAVQCRLADLLAAQVLPARERILLLETHSEHLILRFLRRIREKSANKLPKGVPAVTSDDLCVLYADMESGRLKLTELPVTEEGDFARDWPKGFFEERAEELF